MLLYNFEKWDFCGCKTMKNGCRKSDQEVPDMKSFVIYKTSLRIERKHCFTRLAGK